MSKLDIYNNLSPTSISDWLAKQQEEKVKALSSHLTQTKPNTYVFYQ